MKAYWFSDGDKLGYGDKRIPAVGVTNKYDGNPVRRKPGLLASPHPFEALQFAQGSTMWLVECGGRVVQCEGEIVCTERTYLKRLDAEPVLREFARWCALQVIHLWDAPAVVLRYLEMGDEAVRSVAFFALANGKASEPSSTNTASMIRSSAIMSAFGATLANHIDAAKDASLQARGAIRDLLPIQRFEFQRRVDAAFEVL